MDALLSDLRFALRQLLRRPGFAAAAVATLALGIGANTAIFSVVYSVLMRPLPYSEPERLVRLYSTKPAHGVEQAALSPADVADYRERLDGLELAVYDWYGLAFTDSGRPRDVPTLRVSPGMFGLLGVAPEIGRTFYPGDAEPGAERVLILGHRIWRTELGGDPGVVGRRLELDGEHWRVVGVMPPGFFFPHDAIDLYAPLPVDYQPQRSRRWNNVVGRLGPGVSLEQASEESSAVAAALAAEHPDTNDGWGVRLVPYLDDRVGTVRPALVALLAAVGLVLLIACANVANLLLARMLARGREAAVRASLGAGRGRLIALALTESLLLAVAGGALGLALAWWGLDLLVAAAPADLPRIEEVRVDRAVLAFTAGATLLSALFAGLVPALRMGGVDPHRALAGGGRGIAGGRSVQRARRVLTAAQLALSLALLLGAGLMVRSLLAAIGTDLGFRAEGTLAVQLFVYGEAYQEPASQRAFLDRLLERVEALPGVESAAAVNALPMSDLGSGLFGFRVEGRAEPEPVLAGYRVATPGYLRTLRIPLVAGRDLEPGDREGGAPVAVINEAAARLYFPGADPVGRRFTAGSDTVYTVVGVAGDVRHRGFETAPEPEVFFPFAQRTTGTLSVVVRAAGDPLPLLPAVQEQVWQVDPRQSVYDAFATTDLLRATTAHRRFYTLLLGALAAVALALAAVGLYGVISYVALQRRREIGIRMTLGARRRDVLRLVMAQGAAMVGAGLAAGLAAGWTLGRLARGLLYGVAPLDPATFAVVPALLAAVALVACWLPARRAARIEPLAVLGGE